MNYTKYLTVGMKIESSPLPKNMAVTAEPTTKNPRKDTSQSQDLARSLFYQGTKYAVIAEELGVSAVTIRKWASRGGWSQNLKDSKSIIVTRGLNAIRRETTGQLANASQALRETLSEVLAQHSAALAKVPAKANLKHLAKVGAAIEPLARTAKIVHDWGSEGPQGVVLMTSLVQEPQPAVSKPIDVQGSIERLEDGRGETGPESAAKPPEPPQAGPSQGDAAPGV